MFSRIWRWVKRVFRKPGAAPSKPIATAPTVPISSRQRFPDGYREITLKRYASMEIGKGLLGNQKVSHIDWYNRKLLEGKSRYEKASKIIKEKAGYIIPWQVIGVVHGMEASFDFSKQLLNGQLYTQRTTWVPRNRGPWQSWEESCVDAFRWDSDYKIVPNEWGVAETALFCERWNGMAYWRMGNPSPYLYGFCSVQVPGKFVEDGKYSPGAITMQVGVIVQLEKIGFWNER